MIQFCVVSVSPTTRKMALSPHHPHWIVIECNIPINFIDAWNTLLIQNDSIKLTQDICMACPTSIFPRGMDWSVECGGVLLACLLGLCRSLVHLWFTFLFSCQALDVRLRDARPPARHSIATQSHIPTPLANQSVSRHPDSVPNCCVVITASSFVFRYPYLLQYI